MKFKDYLKIGMIATGLILGGNNLEAKGLENIVNQTKQTPQSLEKKKISTSELIKLATLENGFEFVENCKDNTPFKQQIKKHSFERTARHLAEMKYFSINLADKYSQDPNEIPEKEYFVASRQIGDEDLKFYQGHTNPIDKNVIQARAKTIKIATEGHKKILSKINQTHEGKNVQEQYFNLIKENFTQEEYTIYCEQMSNAMDEYYDALADSLGWKKCLGQGDINKMKKASRESYFKIKDKIYSESK